MSAAREILTEADVMLRLGCDTRAAIGTMRSAGVFYVGKRKPRVRASDLDAFLSYDLATLAVSRHQVGFKVPLCYFVGEENGGAVKVGWSENLHRRLAALQMAHDEPLRVFAALFGTRDLERALHAKFASLRVRGEWFRREGALATLIDRAGAVY